MASDKVRVFDSQGADYEAAFATFLANTDQKVRAREWLNRLVGRLAPRAVFIDAGAGNGHVTAWFSGDFEQTIAIEPNPFLRRDLVERCPGITVLAEPILRASPSALADFILVSHVLYYIPMHEWNAHIERLAGFLGPRGTLVVVLQNPRTDCMALIERFHGRAFDLAGLAHAFLDRNGSRYCGAIETVASHVETSSFDSALTIAEFMLNLLPLEAPPLRSELESIVRREYAMPGGRFRFSCSQDFLVIERNGEE